MPRVVITMPAYHAERTLARTVLAIPEGVADQLILVDDASTDRTAELARGLGLQVHVHPVNRGYGGNQKTCYSVALDSGADIVVMLHPDYQYEPKGVPLLIAPIEAGDADMTFGSRFAGMGNPIAGGMPFYRYIGNRVTTVVQNLLLGTRFTEMHSGMRAYTRRCLESLPYLGYSEGFLFDTELLTDAVTSGLRVVEVPIPTRYTEESSSIGILRSLDYVVRGTVHVGRQVLARGRRGRRYVPGWRGRGAAASAARVAFSSLDAPVDERERRALSAWMCDRLAEYYLGGRRLLEIGGAEESLIDVFDRRSDVGLSAQQAEVVDPGLDLDPGSVDMVIVIGGLGRVTEPIVTLGRGRSLLVPGGLLAIATPDRIAGPAISRMLTSAGFEIVEWIRAPRTIPRRGMVVARLSARR